MANGSDSEINTVNSISRDGGAATISNRAPTISGTPAGTVEEGSPYSFTPTAIDPDGDALTFTISGQPDWTSFDATTGTLSGTPATGDAASYSNITIGVTDGEFTSTLPAFSITVTAPGAANSPPTISGTCLLYTSDAADD